MNALHRHFSADIVTPQPATMLKSCAFAAAVGICFLPIVFSNDPVKNDSSDVYISEEISKGGKRYFIQYRRLGETDTYVNVRRKALNTPITRRISHEDESGEEETVGTLRIRGHDYHLDRTSRVLDGDWNYNMSKADFKVPDVAYELYRLMDKNDRYSIHNATVIRCLFKINSEYEESNIFEFDLSSLDDHEDLEIIDAELNIYRLQKQENEAALKNVDHLIRLYQRLPVNDTNENSTVADQHKLLSVRYISSAYQGWQTFKVKTALDSWMSGEENLGLMITANDPSENEVDLLYADKITSFGEFTPILTVYMKDKLDDYRRRFEIKESKTFTKKVKPLMHTLKAFRNGEIPCSRHIWYVNFQDLGWDNFIVAPKGYMAYRCKGSCKSPQLAEHTNHGRILKCFEDLDENIDGPRCTPTAFKPLVVMFYDSLKNIVIKNYRDMSVEKCGCR